MPSAAASCWSMRTRLFGRAGAQNSRPWGARSSRCRAARRCWPHWPTAMAGPSFWMPRRWAMRGRTLVELINRHAPNLRVVVVGSRPAAPGETAYRKHKIFYYAVEPFSDNEIADILAAVFQTREASRRTPSGKRSPPSRSAASRSPTATCTRWSCWRRRGCCGATRGWAADQRNKLLARMFPVVVTPGEAYLTPANILKTAAACDRVMVLLARDSGRLPGSLAARHQTGVRRGSGRSRRQGGDPDGAAGRPGRFCLPGCPNRLRAGRPYRVGHGLVLVRGC